MINKIILSCFLWFWAFEASAQEGRCPKLPVNYIWDSEKDYQKDEDLVKKTLRWLCQTPLAVDVEQRSLANAFVMEWLAGCPFILVEVKTNKLPFYETNPDLIFPFLHGVAVYKMDKPGITDSLILYKEGFNVVANLALQSKELSHAREIKPLIKAYEKQKMNAYVKQLFEKK